MTLPAEITVALITLSLALIGGLTTLAGVLVRYWQKRIEVLTAKLDANTVLTKDVHTQTNGTLSSLRDEAQRLRTENADLRDEAQRLRTKHARAVDVLRYTAAQPEGRRILEGFEERRRDRDAVALRDLRDLERRLLEES